MTKYRLATSSLSLKKRQPYPIVCFNLPIEQKLISFPSSVFHFREQIQELQAPCIT